MAHIKKFAVTTQSGATVVNATSKKKAFEKLKVHHPGIKLSDVYRHDVTI